MKSIPLHEDTPENAIHRMLVKKGVILQGYNRPKELSLKKTLLFKFGILFFNSKLGIFINRIRTKNIAFLRYDEIRQLEQGD